MSDRGSAARREASLQAGPQAGNSDMRLEEDRERLLKLIQSNLDDGVPLADDVRRRAEAWFGRKMGDVRIHDSEQAAALARRLGAEAFTVRSHVFGPAEKLNPETARGRGLLAHEITHVVQQTKPDEVPGLVGDGAVPPHARTPGRDGGEPAVGAAPRGENAHLMLVRGAGRVNMRRATVDRVSLEVSPDIVQRATEREAQANEVLAGSAPAEHERVDKDSAETAPAVDVFEVAAKVHRLMVQDLIIERERGAFPG